MSVPGHTALGAWSGGRFMHFGEQLDDDRLVTLLRPGADIHTVVTADAYGAGEGDLVVGRAIAGLPRDAYSLIGAVGHDIYGTKRDGSKGFPRFTSPALRGEDGYAAYLREATERSLERCGVERFDVLLLHNPDRIGYTSPAVWEAMAGLREAGLCDAIGLAPGPANGFTLDVIGCLERFGHLIDWAMLILNPLEPWPGKLALPACERHGVRVLARVVDYGGLFHDDVPDEDSLGETDHRRYRAAGWVEAGRGRLNELRPMAERHGLTLLQLSAAWTLAQPAVECVAPTLIQEAGAHAKPVEAKRAELAAVSAKPVLDEDELAAIAAIGDNTGCMALKGASPRHEGDERPDAWPLDDELREVGRRFGIEADRDLSLR
ncbi:MAG TPA: aldo/keto reductase [Gaiellales bacterium]|jgi:aryl-alcohol dehydrogenase-like predicted oxidoreductase